MSRAEILPGEFYWTETEVEGYFAVGYRKSEMLLVHLVVYSGKDAEIKAKSHAHYLNNALYDMAGFINENLR